jgi:hypothetical protein
VVDDHPTCHCNKPVLTCTVALDRGPALQTEVLGLKCGIVSVVAADYDLMLGMLQRYHPEACHGQVGDAHRQEAVGLAQHQAAGWACMLSLSGLGQVPAQALGSNSPCQWPFCLNAVIPAFWGYLFLTFH